VCLGGIPVLFRLLPELSRMHVGPVPLPWLLLGGLVYPVLFVAAWWHVRAAERVEQDFTEILRRR
jgi:hypothetical protein